MFCEMTGMKKVGGNAVHFDIDYLKWGLSPRAH